MPSARHSSDYTILIVLGLLTVGVLTAIALMGWQEEREQREQWLRTTTSTNIEGAIVCYALYERLGLDVRRHTMPLLTRELAPVDVLYVLSPLMALQDDERADLAVWVRNGGVLVAGPELWEQVDRPNRTERHRVGFNPAAVHMDSRWDESLRTEIGETHVDLPLARDVKGLDFGSADVVPENLLPAKGEESDAEELLVDTIGLRASLRPLDQGYVIVLASDGFLANGRIGRFDNAVAAVNLACYALSLGDGSVLAFDEYHFGFGASESAWGVLATLLFTTPAGWCVLVLTAAALLLLFYKGRRFGVRRAPGRQRRRSKLEFVESVGGTFRAAGADYLTFEIIYGWFKRRAAASVGLPPSSPTREIARRLATRAGRLPEEWTAVLAACDDAVAGGIIGRRQANHLLGQLAHIETEALNAG